MPKALSDVSPCSLVAHIAEFGHELAPVSVSKDLGTAPAAESLRGSEGSVRRALVRRRERADAHEILWMILERAPHSLTWLRVPSSSMRAGLWCAHKAISVCVCKCILTSS